MDKEKLRVELKTIIANLIEIDDFGDDERFVQQLGVDSMMALEIVASIEKKYKISIPEDRLPEVQTLNDVLSITLDTLESS